MAIDPQKSEKPKLPDFPEIENSKPDTEKVDILIEYIEKVWKYLKEVKEYISSQRGLNSHPTDALPGDDNGKANDVGPTDGDGDGDGDGDENSRNVFQETVDTRLDGRKGGGKKKQRKTKKKGGADIDYSKVYNVQGLIENISKSTGKDPIASQSVPAPFSTGSPLQRFGKKEAKSLPNELKNEIIPDYSQDGGKKKKTEKKKMPKKK